mmetsp:Transcript_3282/g.3658  ORF Transcript_3282/g.3658 Transcript_3282/m.3658 type:complete len:143 (-) Transcript_3282:286-714(-)
MLRFPILRFIASVYVSFLISASVDSAVAQECANPEAGCPTEEDPNCPSRPHIIRCAGKYLDTNQNRLLERIELENAIDGLSFFSRGILKVIGSVDKIMAKCDFDGDGAISIEKDMPATEETCLATCFKKRAFKGAFFPDCDL